MKIHLGSLRKGDVVFDPTTRSPERLTVVAVQHLGPLVIVDFDDRTSTPPLDQRVGVHIEERAS